MSTFASFDQVIPKIEKRIGYTFLQKEFLKEAFMHRSYLNENPEVAVLHNERLEFLGDAALGLIAAKYLFTTFPDLPEGDLSKLRSNIVDAKACSEYMETLDLFDFLLLGKGEKSNGGRGRLSLMANLFEALLGALNASAQSA